MAGLAEVPPNQSVIMRDAPPQEENETKAGHIITRSESEEHRRSRKAAEPAHRAAQPPLPRVFSPARAWQAPGPVGPIQRATSELRIVLTLKGMGENQNNTTT